MKKRYKSWVLFLCILLFLITWSWMLTFYSPEEIVSYIWINEWYLLVFLVSIIWGVSSVMAISFYTIIITFVAWWLNLFIVWLAAWIWATIWDSIFYYLGLKWKELIPDKKYKYIHRISKWIINKPDWLVFSIIFIYAGLTPLPKDILVIALAFIWYPFKKILLPLILGNITLMILLWVLTAIGIKIT
jgi:hypothetical protein